MLSVARCVRDSWARCTLRVSVACSQSLAEAKTQNNTLVSRLQALQTELSDSEMRCTQVDAQLRQSHNVCTHINVLFIRCSCKSARSSLKGHSHYLYGNVRCRTQGRNFGLKSGWYQFRRTTKHPWVPRGREWEEVYPILIVWESVMSSPSGSGAEPQPEMVLF